MKFNTFMDYPTEVDYFNYTATFNADGSQVRSYFFEKKIKIKFSTDGSSRVLIYTAEPLRNLARIEGIADRNGNEIVPGAIWQISQTEVVLDVFEVVSEYRTRAGIFEVQVPL